MSTTMLMMEMMVRDAVITVTAGREEQTLVVVTSELVTIPGKWAVLRSVSNSVNRHLAVTTGHGRERGEVVEEEEEGETDARQGAG